MQNLANTENGLIGYTENGRIRFQANKVTGSTYEIRVDEYDAGGFHCGVPKFFKTTNSRFIFAKFQQLQGAEVDWPIADRVKEIPAAKAKTQPKPPKTNFQEREDIYG